MRMFATPTPVKSQPKQNLAWIAGPIVGGLAGLALVAGVGLWIQQRRRAAQLAPAFDGAGTDGVIRVRRASAKYGMQGEPHPEQALAQAGRALASRAGSGTTGSHTPRSAGARTPRDGQQVGLTSFTSCWCIVRSHTACARPAADPLVQHHLCLTTYLAIPSVHMRHVHLKAMSCSCAAAASLYADTPPHTHTHLLLIVDYRYAVAVCVCIAG